MSTSKQRLLSKAIKKARTLALISHVGKEMISVILLEKISKLGNIGQEVKVKNGFARNYLIPNKKAIRASEENKKVFRTKKRRTSED